MLCRDGAKFKAAKEKLDSRQKKEKEQDHRKRQGQRDLLREVCAAAAVLWRRFASWQVLHYIAFICLVSVVTYGQVGWHWTTRQLTDCWCLQRQCMSGADYFYPASLRESQT